MDDLLLRTMPHSAEGEQAVLGSMLIDADCVKDVMDKLQAEDFYLQQNRDIFETIYQMFIYGQPIDGLTVADEMEKTGVSSPSTRGYLAQLMDITPTSANVMEYVDIVRDRSLKRQIASVAANITAMIQDGTGEATSMLESAERQMYEIRQGRAGQGMIPITSVLSTVMDQLAEKNANGGNALQGLPTGYSELDEKINGLGKSHFILIAARPGVGKTSFALNMALNVARSCNKTVAIFSLEMSKEELVTRLISAEGFVENTRLSSGNLRDQDWTKIAQATSSLSKMDIRIDDNPSLTVADMSAKCRRLDNLGLVIIDYLQLMSGSGGRSYGGENRQQVVADISRMMKIMAKELQVPIICLSQLSRANEKREDKRPMLSDMRDSGAIEQDADVVMSLYREQMYDEGTERQNICELNVLKNRHGATGKIDLRWLPEYTAFSTMERRYGEDE